MESKAVIEARPLLGLVFFGFGLNGLMQLFSSYRRKAVRQCSSTSWWRAATSYRYYSGPSCSPALRC